MKASSVRGALAVALTLGIGAAAAQTATNPPTGRLLASNCFQCHGTDGRGGFDRLAGKSANEIYRELKEMQTKPSGSDIMIPHAKGYTDAQLRALADYLSRVR